MQRYIYILAIIHFRDILSLFFSNFATYFQYSMAKKLAQTKLPTRYGNYMMIAFESGFPDFPHIAMVKGSISKENTTNVRIHSECLTGDLFHSVRCDCGEQLDASFEFFEKNGGIILYLRQEGRGIGIIKKMEAYNLQNKGMNTIEANHALGFHTDQRDFGIAIEILEELGVNKINLLTNNPEKIKAFEKSLITVVKRIPLEINARKENKDYLKTKKIGMGHLLGI